MSTMAVIGLIALAAVIAVGVSFKLYTRRILKDMDGVGTEASIVRGDRTAVPLREQKAPAGTEDTAR
ncbi:MAG: hypothetical protein ACOX41_09770 [Anaerovoracaceae bacterium]|jgi:hypothetical protein